MGVLGLKEGEVVGVSPFEFPPKKSLIIQLDPSVDLVNLKVDAKALVSRLPTAYIIPIHYHYPCSDPSSVVVVFLAA